jgi:hypothetical protein
MAGAERDPGRSRLAETDLGRGCGIDRLLRVLHDLADITLQCRPAASSIFQDPARSLGSASSGSSARASRSGSTPPIVIRLALVRELDK